jgi:hypothetical protein
VYDFCKNLLEQNKVKINGYGNDVVAIYNVGILMEPILELNPVTLFKAFSKSTALIIIWENQYDKPHNKGVSNYVMAYTTFTFTRGDKTTKTVIFSVDAIKDGIQVEEWLVYDKAAMAEIAK